MTDQVSVRHLMLTDFAQDIRLTFRALARNPGFTSVCLLSLALGLGINISMVSYINALFFRPLPGVPESSRLVSVYRLTTGGNFSSSSYPEYEYCREHTRTFSGMMAYLRVPVILRVGDQPEQVFGELTSSDYFSVLQLHPYLGRLFAGKESSPVAVLSHEFWLQRFGGDSNIVGRQLRIGTGSFTIVGVAPAGFRGIVVDWVEQPSLWVPLAWNRDAVPAFRDFDVLRSWGMESYQVVGRMRDGVSLREAAAEVSGFVQRMRVDRPERFRAYAEERAEYRDAPLVAYSTVRTRFWPGARGSLLSFLALLAGTAVLILLVSLFNVANLVLARAANRSTEFALRLCLGASRTRLLRQLLTENLILTTVGGLAGLCLAGWTSDFLASFGRVSHVPLAVDARYDIRVLAFALLLCFAVGMMLALLTARFAVRGELNRAVRADTGSAGLARLRANQVLVIAQVAVSVALLAGAGLFVRTLRNAQSTDVTVRPDRVILTSLDLGSAGYDEKRGSSFYAELLRRLNASPGVRDAALVLVVPLGGRRGGTSVALEGETKSVSVGFNIITPGYFRTIGIPVVRGRDLSEIDRAGSAPVAVINEEMAQRLFPGRDPIGARFLLKWKPAAVVEVIGTVKDGRFRNYRSAPEPTVYVPLAQRYNMSMNLEVRAAGNPGEVVNTIRREVSMLDGDLPLLGTKTLKAHFESALAQERLSAFLLTALALLALALAIIGIYGVLAYSVARRTREIGIRTALGAEPQWVVRDVLRGVLALVGIGLVAGVAVALALARLVASLLYGVGPADPAAFLLAGAVIVCAAFLAAFVPARRAARVNPVSALRYE